VAATNTVERAVSAGGNRIAAMNQSAVEGVKQATRTVAQKSRQAAVNIRRSVDDHYSYDMRSTAGAMKVRLETRYGIENVTP